MGYAMLCYQIEYGLERGLISKERRLGVYCICSPNFGSGSVACCVVVHPSGFSHRDHSTLYLGLYLGLPEGGATSPVYGAGSKDGKTRATFSHSPSQVAANGPMVWPHIEPLCRQVARLRNETRARMANCIAGYPEHASYSRDLGPQTALGQVGAMERTEAEDREAGIRLCLCA